MRPSDAGVLAALVERNRSFLRPWEPHRPDDYFTVAGQRQTIEWSWEQQALGVLVPQVILLDDEVVGRVTLERVTYGASRSCELHCWVSEHVNGRGVATDAVGQMRQYAFDVLELHRIQAANLVHNQAAHKVLERNGFVRIGLAPRFLHVAGRWQDHVLFQVLAE